jgi:hypothetical protein
MRKAKGSDARQKTFAVIGIRIPAAEKRSFDKRTRTICLRVDPSLYDALCELAGRVCMSISTFSMRILWSYVADQELLCLSRNHRNRGMA